jgi:ParB family chromosome partitioning protein
MTDRKIERRGLGRGLSALMADIAPVEPNAPGNGDRVVTMVPIDLLAPNPDQPRRNFDPASLEELASSIREKGILQPLIVRPSPNGQGYQIVAGERRWRAAQAAQVHDVPVIVRDYNDQELLEVAIIENIQRADLNPVDEALAYRALTDRFGHTQERIAEALGKSRSHIANAMRLLQLPEPVLAMLRDGRLTAGHARALLTMPDPAAVAALAVAQNLTVRDVENLARSKRKAPAKRAGGVEKDADTRAIEADLSAALGMPVQIRHGSSGNGGTLTVTYRTLEDLDALCEALSQIGRRAIR